jgi:hypothetical protein
MRLVVPLVVDYFAYAARPGASAPRAAHRVACRAARRRLLGLAPLVDDYFGYVVRPGASEHRAARLVALR